MLSRKISFLLNAAFITLLISGSHTTLAEVSGKNPQLTEAQKAADKAREDRLAEMRAAIGKGTKGKATPEIKASSEPDKKVAEEVKPTPMAKPHAAHALPPAVSSDKPVHQHRTLQEQIALNKQKKAEELHERNKGKAAEGAARSMTWQERAKLAREKSEAAMKGTLEEKEGIEAHTKPPVKKEPKPLAMSPTQKKLTEKLDAEESKKLTGTAHPVVNLASPPLKTQVEEHEEITLPMPKKVSKPPTPQADTKAEPAKADSPKDDLLAEIRNRKGAPLKSTKQTSQPAE